MEQLWSHYNCYKNARKFPTVPRGRGTSGGSQGEPVVKKDPVALDFSWAWLTQNVLNNWDSASVKVGTFKPIQKKNTIDFFKNPKIMDSISSLSCATLYVIGHITVECESSCTENTLGKICY